MECTICFSEKSNIRLPCGHSQLCKSCILSDNMTRICPSCREPFKGYYMDNDPQFKQPRGNFIKIKNRITKQIIIACLMSYYRTFKLITNYMQLLSIYLAIGIYSNNVLLAVYGTINVLLPHAKVNLHTHLINIVGMVLFWKLFFTEPILVQCFLRIELFKMIIENLIVVLNLYDIVIDVAFLDATMMQKIIIITNRAQRLLP